MRKSPIPAAGGAEEYRGCEMATGEPLADALWREGVVLCDWSWRGRIAVAGPEARKWLNGLLTANTRDLRAGRATASFFLDPKGRALHFFDLAAESADRILILADQAQIEPLAERLNRFRFRARAEVEDQSAVGGSLAVTGPGAEALLAAVGVGPLPGEEEALAPSAPGAEHSAVLRWRLGGREFFEVLGGAEALPSLWERLRAAGARPAGAAAQERRRILDAVPRWRRDIRETDLPQETGEMRAVGVNKGCYIGQEIVERIRSRGAVHRRFASFLFDGPAAPGEKIAAGEREVGELTSAAAFADGRTAALGYIRVEAWENAETQPLRAGEIGGRPFAPPLDAAEVR